MRILGAVSRDFKRDDVLGHWQTFVAKREPRTSGMKRATLGRARSVWGTVWNPAAILELSRSLVGGWLKRLLGLDVGAD